MRYLTIILGVLLCAQGWAQSPLAVSTHQLARAQGQSFAEQHCEEILHKLWSKQGGVQQPAIQISSIAEYGKPAEYDVAAKTIVIDPRAYQLCIEVAGGADDALAFLIAHELVHAFQHRDLGYESPGFFAESTSLQDWAENTKRRWRNMETKADIWGAVLCYLSGYRVEEIIPLFIEDLYNTFELNAEDPLYDSKTERLAIAKRAQQDVKKAIMLYEMANYLTILQQYDKSIRIYQHLADDFRSAEFHNNMGISWLMMAIPRMGAPFTTIPYPFTLDTETRLDAVIKKNQGSPREMIQKGIDQFDLIEELPGEYLAMRVNRACAYHLMSGLDPAPKSHHLERAKADLAYVMSLSEAAYSGAAVELEHLKEKAHLVSAIIQFPKLPPAGSSLRAIRPAPPSRRYSLDEPDYDWKVEVSFSENISVSGKGFSSSLLTLYEDPEKKEGFYVQRITQFMQAVVQKYGDQIYQVGASMPHPAPAHLRKSIPTLQGAYYLVDDKLGVVYKMAANDRVQEWAMYRSVE